MTNPAQPRRFLANRYQLRELLGIGAMGQVHLAEDQLLGNVTVAVKFLSQALLNDRMKERFEREATISALLGEKSSHIVRVRDYGLDEHEIPFYVMEYLSGDSLSEIIKRSPLTLPRFVNLTRQICFGLDCAHRGITLQGALSPIVHRDIKPSNILVVQDAALGELAKILDFGIATIAQSSDAHTQSFMGTLAYSSPEQMEGEELDPCSDIYSLGILMYEMLSGDMPIFPENTSFGGWYEAHHFTPPKPFPPQLMIPHELDQLIMACLAKSPHQRPQSVTEIIQVLGAHGAQSFLPPSIANPRTLDPDTSTRSSNSFVVAPLRQEKRTGEAISLFPVKELCLAMKWPSDKPIQKIVFPQVMKARDRNFVSLWVMLEREDIIQRNKSIRYNQFLCIVTPHPMVLWITVLYHPTLGPRWLPCYLDLKTTVGQETIRLLGEAGDYWILFFALEDPQKCQFPMATTIDPSQCQLLTDWANTAQTIRANQPDMTKRILRRELERLKPQIVAKLARSHPP